MTTQIKELPRENGSGIKLVCGQWKNDKLKKKFLVYKDGEIKTYSDAMHLVNLAEWKDKIAKIGKEKGL